MINDKKIEKLVSDIRKESDEFLTMIKSIGNQCAYTDRMIERIISLSDELKKAYDTNKP